MSSIKQKMLYFSIVFIYSIQGFSQSQWGYGLASGMQKCNADFKIGAGAQSYLDEYRELQSQVKSINADITSKKSQLRKAEADVRKMKFAMQRSLNNDAVDFVSTHSEEQRKCSEYEGMPQYAPRPPAPRASSDTYYEDSGSSTQVRRSSGSETEGGTQVRRSSGGGSTSESSGGSVSSATGDASMTRVRRAQRADDGGGSATDTQFRRSSETTAGTETQVRRSSGSSSGELGGSTTDNGGTGVRRSGGSSSSEEGQTSVRRRMQRREGASEGEAVIYRGPSSETVDAGDKYDLPMDLTLGEFSRMCPAGRRELNGQAICASEAMQLPYARQNKAECASAVNNYAKRFAEVQSLTKYIEAQQELLQTYSQQINEVKVSFTEELNNQQTQQTEGGVCIDCMLNSSEYSYEKPKTDWGNVLTNVGLGLTYTVLGARLESQRQDYNASIGAASEWAPSSITYGYPFLAAGIRGLTSGGGQGAFGCASTMGGTGNFNGANGIMGLNGNGSIMGPYANNSMWGQPAWANANGAVGGSMYLPGSTPWGMNGPWGLSNNGQGVFPQIGGNFGGQLGFGNNSFGGSGCIQGIAGPICNSNFAGGITNGIPGSGINGGYFPGQNPFGVNAGINGGINGGFNPNGMYSPFNTGGMNAGLNGGLFNNGMNGLNGAGAFGLNNGFNSLNPNAMQSQLSQYNQYIQQQQQNLQYYNQYVQQQQQALAAEQQRQQSLMGLQQELQGFWSRYNSILGSGSTSLNGGGSFFPGSVNSGMPNSMIGFGVNGGFQFGNSLGTGYLGSPIGSPVGIPSNSGSGSNR